MSKGNCTNHASGRAHHWYGLGTPGPKNGNFKHGMSDSRLYLVWQSMLSRCRNPRNRQYRDYGGRGIIVCDRWQSFLNFLADMGPGKSGWTLERLNNDLGYCPANCVWATRAQQSRNSRRTKVYTVEGVTGCITDLSIRFGISPMRATSRLLQGFPPELAFKRGRLAKRPRGTRAAAMELLRSRSV
jgi:hypothetical protein